MLTSVQKEILQTLINLYQISNGKSIKGEDIAEVMNRNPGTIRNQMQSLRSLSLVKGVPGPRGGYKPTIEAYHTLNISVTDNESNVPMFKDGNPVEGVSVAKIEFTSIPKPGECEAAIKVLGSIKNLNLGDNIRIGPTPVNNLGIIGEIVGRDDMDNILLLDTTTIRSIPKKTVKEIATLDLVFLKPNSSIKEVANILSKKIIDGAPVIKNNKILGILTLSDIVWALAESKEDLNVEDVMQKNVVTINQNMKIANAVEVMYNENIGRLILIDDNQVPKGIITKTDVVNSITNLEDFPVINTNI
ncbi:Inosine-5'-monophosphate dehydrogenase [Candidatus Methanobinarius endosymbioticus]|uniref:Inosine-5'-monophosphate dehydrogenase n=1 Tax=Candidatus Methanobinarius endosymbioticus TaxID=2006182 RepID=A0A366MA97_9EURY|nr:Inosine-5'-monophosphate dehydrogenase [Candidatus Methanobinarius endosymbioticus]